MGALQAVPPLSCTEPAFLIVQEQKDILFSFPTLTAFHLLKRGACTRGFFPLALCCCYWQIIGSLSVLYDEITNDLCFPPFFFS